MIPCSLALCILYHAFWIYVLPHFGRYRIRQELVQLGDDHAKVHCLVKVPTAELQEWDTQHDALGQRIAASTENESL